MGAEKIIEKIISDANEKAEEIIKKAKQDAESINEIAHKKAADMAKKADENAASEAQTVKQRAIASANMESKKLILKKKQELIEEAFETARKKIDTMDNESFEKLMISLMAKEAETGTETVIIAKKDQTRLSKDFIDKVNSELKSKGAASASLKFSDEQRDIESGFILQRGDIEINDSFDSLLRQKKEELSAQIVKILF